MPGQSGPGSNDNEKLLHIPQSPSITETSPSDYLASYQDTHWGPRLTTQQRCSRCILQPQPTRQYTNMNLSSNWYTNTLENIPSGASDMSAKECSTLFPYFWSNELCYGAAFFTDSAFPNDPSLLHSWQNLMQIKCMGIINYFKCCQFTHCTWYIIHIIIVIFVSNDNNNAGLQRNWGKHKNTRFI